MISESLLSVSSCGLVICLQPAAGQIWLMFESSLPGNAGHQFALVVLKRMSVMYFLHVCCVWSFPHDCRICTSPAMDVHILVPHLVVELHLHMVG